MTTKKITRTFELTIEQNERFIIQRERTFFEWCRVCQSRQIFASPESMARRLEVTQREIFRRLESGRIGFAELSQGKVLVCLQCVVQSRR